MNDDATNSQSSARGGYISFVAHLWVGEDGKLIRGTVEDAHTGTRLAVDLSEVLAFLQASLAHSPGQTTQDVAQPSSQKNSEATAGPDTLSEAEEDEGK